MGLGAAVAKGGASVVIPAGRNWVWLAIARAGVQRWGSVVASQDLWCGRVLQRGGLGTALVWSKVQKMRVRTH